MNVQCSSERRNGEATKMACMSTTGVSPVNANNTGGIPRTTGVSPVNANCTGGTPVVRTAQRHTGGTPVVRAMYVNVMLVMVLFCASAGAGELFDDEAVQFARKINAQPISLLPVQFKGRIAIMDTLARYRLGRIYGSEEIDSLCPSIAFMELYFNSGKYLEKGVIFVKEKNMREYLSGYLPPPANGQFARSKRLWPITLMSMNDAGQFFHQGRVEHADFKTSVKMGLIRKPVSDLYRKKEFRLPLERLSERYGIFIEDLSEDAAMTGCHEQKTVRDGVRETFFQLQDAWKARDAKKVNNLINALAERQSKGVSSIPAKWVRKVELFCNRINPAMISLGIFAAAIVILIISLASAGRRFYRLGISVMVIGTTVLLAGFIVRWIISGRGIIQPPIMNMYEAVVGSAMLGAILSLAVGLAIKRRFIILSGALYAAAAMLGSCWLDADITAQSGLLNSPIMAAHVAVIIIGHALVGMTFFISIIYLIVLIVKKFHPNSASSAGAAEPAGQELIRSIDRCNLVTAQLACWTVAVGTMLGAYWGDFAWGRWWGWDPKETWALITVLVFLAALHARFALPERKRGTVTAIICIIATAVMMFNWIIVNFFIAGKHSYA